MFRLLAAVLLLLLVGLQARLWFGSGGLFEVARLERTVDAQRDETARLRDRNDALAAEVEDLKSGTAAIEERARSELGMIKPGEVFYRVLDETAPARPAGEAVR